MRVLVLFGTFLGKNGKLRMLNLFTVLSRCMRTIYILYYLRVWGQSIYCIISGYEANLSTVLSPGKRPIYVLYYLWVWGIFCFWWIMILHLKCLFLVISLRCIPPFQGYPPPLIPPVRIQIRWNLNRYPQLWFTGPK